MPSLEHFIAVGDSKESDAFAAKCWASLAIRYELQGLIVVRYDFENKAVEVQWTHNIPIAALNGLEKEHVKKALEDCFLVHPKPHVHAMKPDGLTAIICRLSRNLKEQHRLWFFPFESGGNYFVFLGIPEPDKGKSLAPDLKDALSSSMIMLDGCLRAHDMESRLDVTEQFIKEVGHDVASAVQACVAKLRNIGDGRVTGEGARIKAREVEEEIWGVYRVAESLGIVADPNYELRLPEDFDLNLVVKTVTKLFASEAAERHIRLKTNFQRDSLTIWGEKSAIQQAIGQLVSNAIKYSFGGTDIMISTSERDDCFLIRVNNRGHPLPHGPELKQIWDFGFRGALAKEHHVNGSGIGLFTVKKIVAAHRGWKDAQSHDGSTDFFIHLPKKAALKRDLGILL